MKIYTVLNQKGGVGKSTSTINLGYAFAKRGLKTLLIDLDHQGHTSDIYCPTFEHCVTDLFLNKNRKIDETIYKSTTNGKEVDNLYVMPSNLKLAVASEYSSMRVHREKILYNHLKKMTLDVSHVLIDCPPTLGVLAINGIYAASYFLIPIEYARQSLDGVSDLFDVISEVKEQRDFSYTIIRNKYDSRNKITNNFIEEQLLPFSKNVAVTKIRRTETINQSQINKEPVFTFDPSGNGADDYRKLADELIDGI